MKKIDFPFFNPPYSAFICIEMPPLVHINAHSAVNCLLHSIGPMGTDPSGFPGKPYQIPVLVVHTGSTLACSAGPLCGKWKRTINGMY